MRKSWLLLISCACLFTAYADDSDRAFIASLNTNTVVASTIPANGDVNPYGVAVVPHSTGKLVEGSILVSNFNNTSNLQGTGSTIVQVDANGAVSLFAQISASSVPQCTGGVGLTTALAVLRSGFVVVGSLPTTDGTAATAQAGCLIVLDSTGTPVETLQGEGIDGPWDMTALDVGNAAVLFFSNVMSGTVTRTILAFNGSKPQEYGRTTIARGFPHRSDPAALFIGPTGVAFSGDGRLFVADTLASRIAVIPAALLRNGGGDGVTVSKGKALNGPLGLAIAPNGDILTVNAGDGNMVETSVEGEQLAVKNVDATGAGGGTLFGLAIAPGRNGVYFVNDGNNMLYLLH